LLFFTWKITNGSRNGPTSTHILKLELSYQVIKQNTIKISSLYKNMLTVVWTCSWRCLLKPEG
jgi:hypothetical protein